MEAFCTTQQYIARYGQVSDTGMLGECLLDATAQLTSALRSRGIDPADLDGDLLMQACRQMANRVMPSEDLPVDMPAGVTQFGMTGGPYSRQVSFSAPYGSVKVSEAELELLGLSGPRIGWLPLAGDRDG